MTVLTKPFESLQLVAYLAKRCQEKGIALNVTKLQKLLYCCYGVVLAKYGERLTDEFPEAWPYGPVFPEALRSLQFFGVEGFLEKETPLVDQAPQAILELIDATLTTFGKITGTELSQWSHLSGSPWHRASEGGLILYGRIKDADIRRYFATEVLA